MEIFEVMVNRLSLIIILVCSFAMGKQSFNFEALHVFIILALFLIDITTSTLSKSDKKVEKTRIKTDNRKPPQKNQEGPIEHTVYEKGKTTFITTT